MFNSKGQKGDTLNYSKVETVIGEGTTFRGDIESAGTVRIDGRLEGTVVHQGNLIIGPKGFVKANIKSQAMAIAGEVHGELVIEGKLELLPSARLYGSIACGQFVVQEGAHFEGHSNMNHTGSSAGVA